MVPLLAGSFAGTDAVSGCVQGVSADLIKAIRQDPAAYYVNVHSRPNFPGGAVRGHLGSKRCARWPGRAGGANARGASRPPSPRLRDPLDRRP